jgi:hypothetical protein
VSRTVGENLESGSIGVAWSLNSLSHLGARELKEPDLT